MPRNRQRVQTPTGAPYGRAGDLAAAQRAMPLPQGTPVPQGQPAPAGQDRMAAALAAAQAMQAPAGMLRSGGGPGSGPATAGLPTGPGIGPESLPPVARPVNDDSWMLARWLPLLEARAEQPGASASFRQMVRRIRGSLPPQVTAQAMAERQTQGGQ